MQALIVKIEGCWKVKFFHAFKLGFDRKVEGNSFFISLNRGEHVDSVLKVADCFKMGKLYEKGKTIGVWVLELSQWIDWVFKALSSVILNRIILLIFLLLLFSEIIKKSRL